MDKIATIEKWRKILGLREWNIRLRDEEPPAPAKHAAFSEYEFPTKRGVLWVNAEVDIIHELSHILLSGLDDVYWQANRTKALDALWKRREEVVAKRLERAFLRVLRARN